NRNHSHPVRPSDPRGYLPLALRTIGFYLYNEGWPMPSATEPLDDASPRVRVRQFELTVLEGAQAGRTWRSQGARASIGSHASNDVAIEDAKVSRFHCELRVEDDGVLVKDLGSRNGTQVDGVRAVECYLRSGSLLRVGASTLRFDLGDGENMVILSNQNRFG